MTRLALCGLVMIVFSIGASGQTMEDKVTSYLEAFLSDSKTSIAASELANSEWHTSDLMGKSKIYFGDNYKFRREDDGFQAGNSKIKGRWYINNEFVVLEVKKQKVPLFVLKNEQEIVLVDDDQMDVLKQLLTEASYKDGTLKPYSYIEIFTFLNGFTILK